MKWSNVKMAMLLRVSARLALMPIVKATTISKSILDSTAVMSSDNHARIQLTDLYKSCLTVNCSKNSKETDTRLGTHILLVLLFELYTGNYRAGT